MSCDCEYPEVGGEVIERKARKVHDCYECNIVIDKGDIYSCIKGRWEGKWYTFHICNNCMKLRRVLEKDSCCIPYGELQDIAKDYLECYTDINYAHSVLISSVSWLRRGANGRMEVSEVNDGR